MADAVTPQVTSGEGPGVPAIAPEAVNQEPKFDITSIPDKNPEPLGETKNGAPGSKQETNSEPTVEVKKDGQVEVKSDVAVANSKPENVPVEAKPDNPANSETQIEANPAEKNAICEAAPLNKEAELLKSIDELEKSQTNGNTEKFKADLKTREDEVELLRARVKNLETELQAALSKPGSKNHEMIENIKQQHEELLSKARGMIFDKTKMVKNQELQIQALTTQVQSLKDINTITKDLLEIRNSEVKAMEDRLQAMEAKFKAEKERHGLMLQKAETSSSLNGDLKREYEMQLGLFKELRVKYEERVQALVAENARLKDLTIALKGDPTPPQ